MYQPDFGKERFNYCNEGPDDLAYVSGAACDSFNDFSQHYDDSSNYYDHPEDLAYVSGAPEYYPEELADDFAHVSKHGGYKKYKKHYRYPYGLSRFEPQRMRGYDYEYGDYGDYGYGDYGRCGACTPCGIDTPYPVSGCAEYSGYSGLKAPGLCFYKHSMKCNPEFSRKFRKFRKKFRKYMS